MEVSAHSFNDNKRIMVSRNTPLAFLVGVGGFLGSHVAEELLKRNIQVIGIDDFSSGSQRNLREASKNKNFHFIQENISDPNLFAKLGYLKLPRLDYAFFMADRENPDAVFSTGVLNFLKVVQENGSPADGNIDNSSNTSKQPKSNLAKLRTRLLLVSSIDLYDSKLEYNRKQLKEAEVKFAKFVKYYNLNARVVRLATVYGPRMHFRENDPVVRLIQSALNSELQNDQIEHDFSSRALYIDDAVNLLIKSVLSGSTSQKIFDGALNQPVKVSEIKQILLDPLWFEQRSFKPSELPPWPTPNLDRTMKELSWRPSTPVVEGLRKTVHYFKEQNVEIPRVSKAQLNESASRWSFSNKEIFTEEETKDFEKSNQKQKDNKPREENRDRKTESARRAFPLKRIFTTLVLISIVMLGIVYPVGSVVMGALTIRAHLRDSKTALESGDFQKAQNEIKQVKQSLNDSSDILKTLSVFKRLGILSEQISDLEQINSVIDEGIEGVEHAIKGSESLFKTTKIISGEETADPRPLYDDAQASLTQASQKISKVNARLSDQGFQNQFPEFIKVRIIDLQSKLNLYQSLVDKARVAAILLPEITAIDGKKSYLVLLQNNLELRPTGGFIGSYGKFDFEKGRLVGIKVDDIYNLDGGLQEIIEPPQELRSDLNIQRWFLRDSNFDPDFPTSARQASFFYKKEAGSLLNGVVALDLSASAKLVSAVGGLDLPEYGEHVDGDNLFEKVVSHAEVGFFPGSQAKKNYLVSLQNQLFNKVFYLSKQNWPAIIASLGSALEQKHMLVYFDDPKVFSYLVSANWSGVMPRGAKDRVGETSDFIAVNESNMGANKSNYYLKREYDLETVFTKEGGVNHKLFIQYVNNSPSDAFPGGVYKNRIRIYLPLGAKLEKASLGESDITTKFTSFSDYGRTAYSALIEVLPKEAKKLIFEYSLAGGLNFKDTSSIYRLDVLKQPGTDADPFDWKLAYPINFEVKDYNQSGKTSVQEVSISTNLLEDRRFEVLVNKK